MLPPFFVTPVMFGEVSRYGSDDAATKNVEIDWFYSIYILVAVSSPNVSRATLLFIIGSSGFRHHRKGATEALAEIR